MARPRDPMPDRAVDLGGLDWIKFLGSRPTGIPLPPVRPADPGSAHLWAAEALHRTNNLAQLVAAIAQLRSRFPANAPPAGLSQCSHELSQSYAELAAATGGGRLPCGDVTHRIATGLIALFGASAKPPIRLDLRMTALALPPDRRRALVLIISELIVNALKHAFPQDRAGTVTVTLTVDRDVASLIVADDGVGDGGRPPQEGHGQGQGLLDGLTYLLGGIRTTGPCPGGGHQVLVRFPLH